METYDVISAFLDNEPFDPDELARTLAEPDGREAGRHVLRHRASAKGRLLLMPDHPGEVIYQVRRRNLNLVRHGANAGRDRARALPLVILSAVCGVASLVLLVRRAERGARILAIGAVASLVIGYWVPRIAGVRRAQAIACSMEVGIHNSTLAMTIAISLLDDVRMAVPAGVYGVGMLPLAYAAGVLMTRRAEAGAASPARAADPSADR